MTGRTSATSGGGATGGPGWAAWGAHSRSLPPFTVGVEEEVMLVDPATWALAQAIDDVLPALTPGLASHVSRETHGAALELGTGVHETVAGALVELRSLRTRLKAELEPMGLSVASAGTHPFAVWQDVVVASGERQNAVYGSMRELARREPTFALHVHVGIPDPEDAIRLANQLRGHLPLLLAASANSPFWQGRETGLASARTPLFQAFPRVGIPRAFDGYADYVDTVDLLIRCEAFPEPTFLWWDVRPQPRFGTVEVRVMDAQATLGETAALVALVQSLARLEIVEGHAPEALLELPELLDENRFLAARDGMDARLIDPSRERRVPATDLLSGLLERCEPHADALGAGEELAAARSFLSGSGARHQLELARRSEARLPGLVAELADAFLAPGPPPYGDSSRSIAPLASETQAS